MGSEDYGGFGMSHKKGTYCGGIRTLQDLKDRCVIDPITGCWNWSMSISQGLPNVHIPHPVTGERIKTKGRRAALMLKTGQLLPSGWFAIRKPTCESPICCNPDHAFMGDGKAYGESVKALGTFKNSPARIAANTKTVRSTRCKLTLDQAALVRNDERPVNEIAEDYGVSKTTVYYIKRGVTYRQTFKTASIFSMGAA